MTMLTAYVPARSFTSDLWNDYFESSFKSVQPYNGASEFVAHDDYYLLSIDLPGMKLEDIKIEMADEVLTVSGERKRFEKSYGTFRRSYTLPSEVDSEKIEARYESGVLEVYLPKTPASKPRSIQIQSGKSSFFEKLLGSKKNTQDLKDVTTN